MKPILFAKSATQFNTNGLGRIDCRSCIVTEERNGMYELEMIFSLDALHASEVDIDSIIVVQTTPGGSLQPFRVYEITEPWNGQITAYARHITYQTLFIPVMPFTVAAASGACATSLTTMKANAAEACPFTFWTDVVTVAAFGFDEPVNMRACLSGTRGSILDTYGGEYEWDGYTVKLHKARGKVVPDVTLRYGKNITDLQQERNIANTVTGVCPFWKKTSDDTTTLVTVTEKVVESQYANRYAFRHSVPLDLSQEFDEAPTEAQLRNMANVYLNKAGVGLPSVSIEVSFVALWQTEEYKDIAPLENVKLCDNVTVIFEKLGISETAKVVKTVYNVLADRYESITLGTIRPSLASIITDTNGAIEAAIERNTFEIKQAEGDLKDDIVNATKWLTETGGYVIAIKNQDGTWGSLVFSSNPDPYNAHANVLRINQNGIGFSSTGANGTFTQAWTLDGKLVIGGTNAPSLTVYQNGATSGNILFRISKNGLQWNSENSSLTESGILTLLNGFIKLGEAEEYPLHTKRYNFELDNTGEVRIGRDTTNHKHMVIISPSGNANLGYVERYSNVDRYNFQLTNDGEIGIGWDSSAHRYRLYYDGSAMTIRDGALKVGYVETHGGAERYKFVVDEAGNLGVGWDASAHRYNLSYDPTNGLIINGGGSFSGDISAASGTFKGKLEFYKQNDPSWLLTEINPDGEKGAIIFHGSEVSNRGWKMAEIDSSGIRAMFLRIMDGTSHVYGTFYGGSNNSAEVICSGDFIVQGDGVQRHLKVSDGNATINGDLTVSGTIHNSNSDRRLKKNIKALTLKKAKDFIMRLVPKTFKFKRDDGRVHHGFIAQEVEEFADWGAVYDTPNSYKGIPYDEYIADLVMVVQDQEKRINDLEERLAALERSSK